MQFSDEKFMQRAIDLANKGKFKVSPNPRVGAVIVYKNEIIGEGYHQEYGQAHAEVNAINAVQNKALLSHTTIYITLEPCSHFGKTPPCVDLLIKHNFKRVVIANKDPFKKVDGSGIEKLKRSNIEVCLACLNDKGKELNKRFFSYHAKKRPYIILKWAETVNGFIGRNDTDLNVKDSWITNAISKQLVHSWRAEEDAILVGKNTVINDNPELTCRETIGKNPTRIVLDSKLELDLGLKVFNKEAKTFVLNSKVEKEENNLHYFKSKHHSKLTEVVNEICYTNEIQSIIVEGGANVLNQFIAANMWDEARVFVGEKKFGKGIKAPNLNQKPIVKEQIENDQLFIYKNKAI